MVMVWYNMVVCFTWVMIWYNMVVVCFTGVGGSLSDLVYHGCCMFYRRRRKLVRSGISWLYVLQASEEACPIWYIMVVVCFTGVGGSLSDLVYHGCCMFYRRRRKLVRSGISWLLYVLQASEEACPIWYIMVVVCFTGVGGSLSDLVYHGCCMFYRRRRRLVRSGISWLLYVLQASEEACPIWYIMDEFGCRIQHADSPSVKMCPFFYSANETAYTIMWPIHDLAHGGKANHKHVAFPLHAKI